MNDLEIEDLDGIAGSQSQLDKLKNLLIEFGVEFEEYSAPACHVVALEEGYHGVEFYFDMGGTFNTFAVD